MQDKDQIGRGERVGDGGGIPPPPRTRLDPSRSVALKTRGKNKVRGRWVEKLDKDRFLVSIRLGEKVYRLGVRQWEYLKAVHSAEEGGEEAIKKKLGVGTREYAGWLKDVTFLDVIGVVNGDEIKAGMFDEKRWKAGMIDVWNGDKKVTKNQMEAGKELGMRVAPKVEKVQHEFEELTFTFRRGIDSDS